MSPGADAVIFPIRENFLEAIEEALAYPYRAGLLYTNHERVALVPRPLPGWQRIHAAIVKETAPCVA